MAERKSGLNQVIQQVAAQLGNTPAVCRKCYIHPAVIESFLRGDLHAAPASPAPRRSVTRLGIDEHRALDFLVEYQKRSNGAAPRGRRNGTDPPRATTRGSNSRRKVA
jgi:DNA topoisomerase-1